MLNFIYFSWEIEHPALAQIELLIASTAWKRQRCHHCLPSAMLPMPVYGCVWLVAGLHHNIGKHWITLTTIQLLKPPSCYSEFKAGQVLGDGNPSAEHEHTGTMNQEYQITKEGSWTHTLKTHPESTCASGCTTCVTSWENYQGVTDEALFKLSVKIHANTARHFDQVSHFAAWFVRVSVMYVRMSQSCGHLHIWGNEIPFFPPIFFAERCSACSLLSHLSSQYSLTPWYSNKE